MTKIGKKALCVILIVLSVILSMTGCGGANKTDTPETTKEAVDTASKTTLTAVFSTETAMITTEKPEQKITAAIKKINKHGNVVLDTSFTEMADLGIEIGDIITVFIGDKEYDLPVGTSFTDVDSGNMVCRFDLEDNEVALAINMGSFAADTGIGKKQTIEEDPGYKWDIKINGIGIVLKEKQGYIDEYTVRNLTRTDVREDYADLSDEEFANFRAVRSFAIKENVLYRSSSPLRNDLARNVYAMEATEKAGIKSVINLDDSAEMMKSYATYADSYYSKCVITNPEMDYDFGSESFAAKVKECISFIVGNDGPYLIHCKEGKDRTGILCAVIECFAGASAAEVEYDYMMTYRNFYNVKPTDGANTYNIILKNNLVKTLCELYGVDDLGNADLVKEAKEYLLSTGLTQDELSSLSEKLKKTDTYDMTKALQLIAGIGDDSKLSSFGESKPSDEAMTSLENEISALTSAGHDVSLIMIDLETGSGVSYNSSQRMCGQSTIKAVYIGSLLYYNPSLFEENKEDIRKAIELSDNEAYEGLREKYGTEYLDKWCVEVGVETDMITKSYPRPYVKDLCRLWTKMYEFLNSSVAPDELKAYYGNSINSAAKDVLGDRCKVHSKAGWENGLYGDEPYTPDMTYPAVYVDKNPDNDECAINDTGIVYTEKGPYIFAIFTDCPFGMFDNYTPDNPLNGMTEALYVLQQSIK